MVEACLDEGGEFGFGEAHSVSVAVFGGEVSVKHGGVIGRESYGDAVTEKPWERVQFDGD